MRRLWFYIAPLLVFVAIWQPQVSHYYVSTASTAKDQIQRGRSIPEDVVLDELSTFSFELTATLDNHDRLIRAAEQIVAGTVDIPGFPRIEIGIPFNPADLDRSPAIWQLPLAGFVVPRILLQAFRATGRNEFLVTARDIIIGWAVYEHSAWFPRGFLWNDHAVAARVLVVAEFWRLYRNDPSYDGQVGDLIFKFMSRTGEMLAKPAHFTLATNHGVMQNLALWHLCLSFPTLPQAPRYRRIALERLQDQMGFYVSAEGVVLEHSAGYHKMGVELIAMAFRYMTLLNIAIPHDWRQKYENALNFFATIRRPDGSLPKFGDTGGDKDDQGTLVADVNSSGRSGRLSRRNMWFPANQNSLYPVSGYSVWWRGLSEWPHSQSLNQTVVAWSNFPGHGHKHADDMSVLFWAHGKSWWESVGYWPYEDVRRREATSWRGSNAPHLLAEPAESARNTTLRFYGSSNDASFVDMERQSPGKYGLRRQILAVDPNLWIVIDSSSSANQGPTISEWRTGFDVQMVDGRFGGSYELQTVGTDTTVTAVPFGSSALRVRRSKGSGSPLEGWTVVGRTPHPTDSLILEQPDAVSWSAMSWTLNNRDVSGIRLIDRPHMRSWKNADEWHLIIPHSKGATHIERQKGKILVTGSGSPHISLDLSEATGIAAGRSEIGTAYDQAKSKYPLRFRDLTHYRMKVTGFLGLILILQEAFFLLYARIVGYYYVALRIFNVCGWGVVGSWLVLVYFQT